MNKKPKPQVDKEFAVILLPFIFIILAYFVLYVAPSVIEFYGVP